MDVAGLAGWLPATIIPTATALQLFGMWRRRSAAGVDPLVWGLFGVANLGLYVYTEKYVEPQAVLGLLLTAVLDFWIAALALVGYGRR